jgi:hypothetical protein
VATFNDLLDALIMTRLHEISMRSFFKFLLWAKILALFNAHYVNVKIKMQNVSISYFICDNTPITIKLQVVMD